MGSYLSQANLTTDMTATVLAQLTAASGTTPDAAVVAMRIEAAEGEVNSYLSTRIAVPVDVGTYSDAAPWLAELTRKVTVKNLWAAKGAIPPAVQEAYDAAIKTLVSFAAGELAFPSAVTPTGTTANDPIEEWVSETLVSGADDMGGL